MKGAIISLCALAICISAVSEAKAATWAEIKRSQIIAKKVYPQVQNATWRIGGMTGPNRRAEADWNGCQIPERKCEVRYEAGFAKKASFADMCSVTIHEYGHLAGFYEAGGPLNGYHSADPKNNMYEYATHHGACGLTDIQRLILLQREDGLQEIIDELRFSREELWDNCRGAKRNVRTRCKRRETQINRRINLYKTKLLAVQKRLAI